MESLERHEELVRGCSLCFAGGGNTPVVDVAKEVRVLLVAQEPGVTDVSTGLPFTGPAGKRLEGWFEEAGVSRREIYLSALARCFPGKAPGGGDRAPSRAMIANCRPHLPREFEPLRPEVVAPVGGLAVRELLGIGRLSEAVGETILRDEVVYVPLPHLSGASTWLNLPENRGRLFRALAELGRLVADGRIGGSGARARRLEN
ncbi:MAG: uracil-DNA glycosylase family protein [Rubrobacteraceae bacterium]